MNKRHLNAIWKNEEIFTTDSFANLMPIWQQKLGPDVPLRFAFTYRDMKVYFGRPQANIVAEFYMQMQGFRDFDDPLYENLHLSSSEFFYDEFKF
jgi:hypothetical protein